MNKIWHRFEDYREAHVDEYGDVRSVSTRIRHCEFELLKETPKGVWLKLYTLFDTKRFVLKDARKKFANETLEGAKKDFIARKTKQISIYQARIDSAKTAIELLRYH